MFQLINVSLDYGRMKDNPRTRLTDAQNPVFSWGAINDRKSAHQKACRATVHGCGLSWDSGWVEQKDQMLRYAGDSLPEGETLTLTLQIQDDAGNLSDLYTQTFFNANVEWRAPWIGAAQDERGKTLHFRRDFAIDRPVASAILYACGIGYHKLYLDGDALDVSALDPAHTDYSKTCQYVAYPAFEKYLTAGQHCLGAMVGEGWRRNSTVFPGEHGGVGKRPISFVGIPAFTAMLRITYATGETEWIVTDESWQYGRGAYLANDLFNGDTYDASQTSCGWNMPGHQGYAPAAILPAPGGVMRPMLVPPILEHRVHAPIAAWPISEDAMIVDFGQNMAGVTRIRLPKNMKKGQTISIAHAEVLDEDGSLYTLPLRAAKATDTYIASGDARDLAVWQPLFNYHGFRYAKVEGLGAGFDSSCIEAVELYTDLDTRSTFRCGNPLVTKIHDACVATERANQHSILTDCPNREERMAWMNDATVRFEETPYNFEVGRIFPKLIRDLLDSQREDGAISCTAPLVFGNKPADPVCSSFLVAGMQGYLHTGNLDTIAEAYAGFCGWEECLLANSTDYIVNYSYYGDWAGPAYACEGEDGAVSKETPGILMSTGYSYFNCTLLSQFASLLGDASSAAHWAETAEKIKAAMLSKWYDSKEAKMATGSHGSQVFALWLGIVPEEDAPRAAKRLRDDLVEKEYRFTTGNLCTRYLMDVLTKFGYLEDAWTLVTKDSYPSFGFMMQHEATTIWERFELKKAPGMNSHNHPMYGAVDYWFYAHLCGITPLKAAYDEVLIAPSIPNNLLSAQAVVDTVKGELSVRWSKRYGATYLYVTIPFGATAKVVFGGETHQVGSGFHVFSQPVEA